MHEPAEGNVVRENLRLKQMIRADPTELGVVGQRARLSKSAGVERVDECIVDFTYSRSFDEELLKRDGTRCECHHVLLAAGGFSHGCEFHSHPTIGFGARQSRPLTECCQELVTGLSWVFGTACGGGGYVPMIFFFSNAGFSASLCCLTFRRLRPSMADGLVTLVRRIIYPGIFFYYTFDTICSIQLASDRSASLANLNAD